ncbi:MAG: patatin-like phospholipase family protein [Sphingobacteriales bacterium]|nr:patatin-like phospholipase family protein [Sphingobacteriales bacterium]MBI3717804.1 patatin-like phospholipase family protein [Sphingobacteriales bacterium]
MKKSNYLFIVFILLLAINVYSQQPQQRPKIGLTLSGGGAKGLAHIGILKAIDSAGLKIDYVTGTSMGGVIGGLYAVGYSADTIEKISRTINWDLFLSNQASLRTLYMEEKDEYNKYNVELPWVNHKFRLPSGLLQGQEVWVKLSELFYPVYNQKDFSKFSKPFKCIATDVGTGEAVVLSKGEIASAIRASMAIPSFFTAADIDGKRLIDGGIVRNFPVRDVKEMGADIVIGSNVAGPLLPSDKVQNAIQVLLQVAFFREAADSKEEQKLCNVYVDQPLKGYNMGSFSQAKEIIEKGIERGRELYPVFKRMADSLDAIYGKDTSVAQPLPESKPVIISSYEVNGLVNTSAGFFINTIDLLTNKEYTPLRLTKMVRAAYGTRYYSRITYSLVPQEDGTCKIIFDVTENPLTFFKAGLHYNRFSGIAAIVNFTSRNLLFRNSRSMIAANIGETLRARAEHLQYYGRRKNFSTVMSLQGDRFDISSYNTLKQDGIFKQEFFKADFKAQFSTQRNFTIGLGQRFEYVTNKPKINAAFDYSGNNSFVVGYLFLAQNNLDKTDYPHRGVKLNTVFEWVGTQHPRVDFFINGVPVNKDSITVTGSSYARVLFNMDAYTPFGKRTTAEFQIQAGANFKYGNNIMNEFVVGGLTKQFRNQVSFAGLQEGSIYTPAMMVAQVGLRYEFLSNTFLIGRGNVLFNNFISKSKFYNNPDIMTGYSLTFGYNFALGPLELSLMYNDQSKKLGTYVNIGVPF